MRKQLIITIALGIWTSTLFAQKNIEAEKEAVKKVVKEAYVEGLFTKGDVNAIKKGWHHNCDIVVHKKNRIEKTPISQWVHFYENEAKGPLDPKAKHEFTYVHITGDAAIAIVELHQNNRHVYTDYLSLYKLKGSWKIVSKTYYEYPVKRKPANINKKVYDELVGKYQLAPNYFVTISKETEKLFMDTPNHPQTELIPIYENQFYIKSDNNEIIFTRDNKGKVAELLIITEGKTYRAKRV